jgi:GT2 family glycosyltransferase
LSYKILGLCRGNGKGYVKILTEGVAAGRLYATATAENGTTLACAAYEMGRSGEDRDVAIRAGAMLAGNGRAKDSRAGDNNAGGSSARIFVIAVPLLDGTKLSVQVFESRDGGQPAFSFPFNPLESKIQSRLFYRRHHDEAMQIRDIDQRRLSGQPFAYATGIYYITPTEVVCRFHATVPYEDGAQYEAFVVDAQANPVGKNVLTLEDSVVPDPHNPLLKLRELGYSVALHGSDRTLCINVRKKAADGAAPTASSNTASADSAPDVDGCFTCLLPPQVDGFTRGATDYLQYASQDPRYHEWFEQHRATPADIVNQREAFKAWDDAPLVSIVTPVFRTPANFLHAMIQSVLAQSYERFELILVNASGVCPEVDQVLAQYHDPRIRVIACENKSISENTNIGINAAQGDYLAFVDHDDTIEPDALYRYMIAVREDPETDLLYCDEDHLRNGSYEWPIFKPDFNPDLLYTQNYITHMLMVSRTALAQVELSGPEVNGAQDYDLTLKCAEVARSIHNVPYMLYHWREHSKSTSAGIESKSYAVTGGVVAVKNHFSRVGIDVDVEERKVACTYKTVYRMEHEPKVSIIIPTMDHVDLLRACIDSVLGKTTYGNYEIVCVENNSKEQRTFGYYDEIQQRGDKVRVVTWPGHGFNYSAICNFGAQHSDGELLLFLNNDTEVISADWLTSMAGFFMRKEVGVVGAKLYNFDGLIQHAGIWVVPGGFDYINSNFSANGAGYMNLLYNPSDMAAVTGACQMVRRSLFDEVGGLDEQLAVALNDVDLCLKTQEKGYLTVFDPDAELYHHESSSRGSENRDVRTYKRFDQERYRFLDRWSGVPRGKFVNINLDQYNGYFKIAW